MVKHNKIFRSYLSIFLFLLATSPVLAQDQLEASVKKGLEEIVDAQMKLRTNLPACETREPLRLLLLIEASRKEAEAKYRRALNANNGQMREFWFNRALEDIRQAKSHVAQAETALRLLMEALLLKLNRQRNVFGELMRRAEQNVFGSKNRQAERLVNQAKKMQVEAERAALQRNICLATSGYEHANNSLREALKLVEGPLRTPEATLEVTINREKERYENLETRARDAIETSKNSSAALVFAQAQKQGRAAEEAWRKGEIALAQQLYRGATRLLLRAIDLALAGKNDQELGRNETALLQELIQAAEQEIQDNSDPRAALLLERARNLVREAEAAIERRQPQDVRWRLELARNFIDKAVRHANRSSENPANPGQRFNEALQELGRDIEEVRAKAREANKLEALQLVELAANAHQSAETAGRQSQTGRAPQAWRGAFQMIRAAQYFLLRAETMLRDASTPNTSNTPSRDAVAQRLNGLETNVQGILSNDTFKNQAKCEMTVKHGMELIKRSRAALERGEVRLALSISEVANDLIEQCLK